MMEVKREPDLMEGLDPAERRLALGHRLMMLGHLDAKLRKSRAHLDRYRNQVLDQALGTQQGEPSPTEDNMLVLGNVTNTINHLANPSADETQPTLPAPQEPAPPATEEPSAISKALPYVLTALVTAGGLGGAGWLAGLFDKPEPPAVEQPADLSTPPGYGLSL